MGGRNAFSFAALHPELVRALVIVDIAPEVRAVRRERNSHLHRAGGRAGHVRGVRRAGQGLQPPPLAGADQGQPGTQPETAAQRQVDVEVRQGAAVAVAAPAGPWIRRAAVGLHRRDRVPYPSGAGRVQQGAHPGDRGGDGAAPAARRRWRSSTTRATWCPGTTRRGSSRRWGTSSDRCC